MSQETLKEELSHLLSGKKVLIVGIGNQLRSDDGFGPALISRLQGRVGADCLDVGPSPENYIGKIIKFKPEVILFLDSVSMDDSPATIKLIKQEEIPEYGFSTHNMSPKLMIDNISSQINTKIFMIGMQPRSIEFGEKISEDIQKKIEFLESILNEILGR